MKRLDNANDKIQMICEQIKNEAINPALIEAEQILNKAKLEAEAIKAQALKEIDEEKIRLAAFIEKEKEISQNALRLAIKQSIERLKFEIVNLFNEQLMSSIELEMSRSDITSKLIESVCDAIVNEGIYSPLHLTVGNKVPLKELVKKLSDELKEKLADKTIAIGSFAGGAEIKLQDKNLTIDISDKAVKELFSSYLKRPEFRSLIFKE